MELSGRLIPDGDNRVLMTPFIVGFFFGGGGVWSLSNRVKLQNSQPETGRVLLRSAARTS